MKTHIQTLYRRISFIERLLQYQKVNYHRRFQREILPSAEETMNRIHHTRDMFTPTLPEREVPFYCKQMSSVSTPIAFDEWKGFNDQKFMISC